MSYAPYTDSTNSPISEFQARIHREEQAFDEALNKQKREMERRQNGIRQEKIKRTVREKGYIELKSDYFNMSSYYFDPKSDNIFEVVNIGDVNPIFFVPPYGEMKHIAELNKVTVKE